MKPRVKKIALTIARFAIPAAIIAYLLWHNLDAGKWHELVNQEKRWGYIAAALLLSLGVTVLSFVRWWLLVRSLEIPLKLMEALRLGAIGNLLSYVTPGSLGGDVVKGVFLAHRSRDRRIEAFASIGVDRVMGLTGLLIVVSIALLAFPIATEDKNFLAMRSTILTVTPIGIMGLAALMLGGKSIDRLLGLLPKIPYIGNGLFRLSRFVRVFHHRRSIILIAILMSVLNHTGLVLSVDLLARGLFTDLPTFREHLVIVPMGMTATALPLTPGGLGVFEGALQWLYKTIPANPNGSTGLMVALAYDISRLIIASIGIVFYWTAGREVRESIEEAETEPELEMENGTVTA